MMVVSRLVVGARWRWDGSLGYFLGLSLTLAVGAAAAQGIVPDGRTSTTVDVGPAVTSVRTTTTSGVIGFNSFQRFSVEAARTANLFLPAGTSHLVNIVRDQRTDVFGTLNAIQDNVIGGNVWFATPNGFLVGNSGVVNVGSLNVTTPTAAFVDSFFLSPGNPNPASVTQLMAGTAPRNAAAAIRIDGQVNALGGVTLSAGQINVGGVVYSGARFSGAAPDFSDVVNDNGLVAANNVVASEGRILIVADRSVALSGTLAAPGGPAGVNAGNIDVSAARSDGGSVDIGLQGATLVGKNITLMATSQRSADLTPLAEPAALAGLQTIDAAARIAIGDSQLDARGGIEVAANAALDLSATGPVPVAILRGASLATVEVLGNSSLSTAGGAARLNAGSNVSILAAPTSPLANLAGDAMVATSSFSSTASVHVGDSATARIAGALELGATNTVQTTQRADASAAGSSAAGAVVALSLIDSLTSASIDGQAQVLQAESLSLSALSSNSATVQARSAARGAGEDSSGAGQASQTMTKYEDNTRTGDSGASGGGVKVAGAVAVSDLKSSTFALMSSSLASSVDGAVTLSSQSGNQAQVGADGSATSGATGVGVAVAVNLARSSNQALVAQPLQAQSLELSATMVPGRTAHDYESSARSGAGASDVGIAGSVAVNVLDHEATAALRNGADVSIAAGGSGDVVLRADQAVIGSTSSTPADGAVTGSKVGIGAAVAVHVASSRVTAELGSGALLAGARDLDIAAGGASTLKTHAEAGSEGGVSITPSAAISVVNNTTSARIGSGTRLTLAGDLRVLATQRASVETTAEGSSQGETAAIGAAVAVALVDDRVSASTAREIVADGSAAAGKGQVRFEASGASASSAEAKASAVGGKGDDEAGSTDPATGQTAEDGSVDDKVNKQLGAGTEIKKKNAVGDTAEQNETEAAAQDDKASASTSEGKVSVAAAVAVNRQKSSVIAAVPDDGELDAAGLLTIASSNNTDGAARSDGSAVGSSTALGIGAGVSVNLVKSSNEASIGRDADVKAQGLTLQAQMTDLQGDGSDLTHTLDAQAKSGAGGSKVGIAGSLALNIADTSSQALLKDGAEVDARGGKLSLSADGRSDITAKALPADDGGASGGKVGIGASVAVNVVAHRAIAEVQDSATLLQPGDIELAASGRFAAHTEAEAGASGGVAITPVLALAMLNHSTRARLGSGSELLGTGTVSISATQQSSTHTSAKGSTQGEKAAIGAAVGVLLLDDSTQASLERNLRNGSAGVSVTAQAQSASTHSASASSKGGKGDDEAGQTDAATGKKKEDASVDDKVGGQLDFGKKQQTDNDVGDADQKSATAGAASDKPSAQSDEGKVSVAAAVAVNIIDARARARIGDGVIVDTAGPLLLQASGNTDGRASADAQAVGKTAQVGIGAAVAVNKLDSHNEASIGSGAQVTAQGVTLIAGMTDVGGDRLNTLQAQAQSGAGGSKVGIAASLALNLADTSSKALVQGGAAVDALGAAVVLSAEERSTVSAKAEPTTSGGADGGKVGVGVSVALNIVDAATQAQIASGAGIAGAGSLAMTANAQGDSSAIATAGATGGKLAFDAAVAVSTLRQHTDASIASGIAIGVTGQVDISAESSGTHTALTKGVAKAGSVAVGASVGVIDSVSTTTAGIDRNVLADGSFELRAAATRSYDASARASAGGSQSEENYDNNKTQADSASSTKTLQKNQDSETNQGTQGGGKVNVAAAVGVVVIDDDVGARVSGGRTIASGAGEQLTVSASNVSNFSARGAGDAVDPNAKVGVGIGVGLAINRNDTLAALDDSTHVTGSGDLNVLASSTQNTDPAFASRLTAEGLAGAGGSKVGVAGAFAVAYSKGSTSATIGDDSLIDQSALVTIQAENRAALAAKAWAGAFGNVGVGASVATVISDNAYQATLGEDTQLTATGLRILALNRKFSPTPFSLDLSGLGDLRSADSAKQQLSNIADQFTSGTLLGGGNYYTEAAAGAAGDRVAVAGSFAVNVFKDRTEATLGAGAEVDTGSGAVELRADNDGVARSLAGSLAAGGSVGVGVSSAVVASTNVTRSHIGAGAQVTQSGSIGMQATNRQDLQIIGVAGGVSNSVAVSGVANVITLDNQVEASVADSTSTLLNSSGDVTLSALQDLRGMNIATGLSVSGSVAVGVVAAVNTLGTDANHQLSTHATLGEGVRVNAGGRASLDAAVDSSLRTFAIAGAASGSVSVGGAAVANVMNSDTRAHIGADARLNEGQALAGQRASLRAQDDTELFTVVTGVAAGGSVGVGASADVAVIQKHTEASIGADAKVYTAGDLLVDAAASEDFRSIAIGLGVGGSAGAAGSVSVYSLTGETQALVGDALLSIGGSARIAADSHTEMDLIAGSASGGGGGAIGAAAGVSVFHKTTEARIGGGADVEVLGNGVAGIDAATGEMAIAFGAAIGEHGRVRSSGVAPKDARGNALAGGQDDAIGNRNAFQALTRTRSATPVETSMRGLAVTATNRDRLNSFSVTGAAGGGLAVTLGGNVAVLESTTSAAIDGGARINQNGTVADAGQSVRVAAGNDQFHLGLAGAASGSGGVAVGAGADVMVGSSRVEALIGADAKVDAARDVEVLARNQGQYLEMGAGLAAAGSLAIAGSVGVLSLDNSTQAMIVGGAGTTTEVVAGGNLRVRARDDTEVNMIAGAAAAGFGTAGFGVAVGVNTISKDTRAEIGDRVSVNALGGSGAAAFDAYLPDAASDMATASMRGLQVEALSKEDLFVVSASGAGGLFAGISGAVTVAVVDSVTVARIGNNALVNTDNTGAATDQDLNVSARNELKSLAFTGSVAIGAAGISGGVDVLTARNRTHSAIGDGTEVHAARDVAVNALSSTDLDTTVVSAAGGLVAGVAGGVSLYSVGDKLGSDAQGELNANGDVKGQADREARGGALGDLLASSSDARVRSTSTQAQNKRAAVSTDAATGGAAAGGNNASIGAGAKVFSGRDTSVQARGQLAYSSTTGAAAVGALGLGAGIGIADLRVDNRASIASAEITAGGDLNVQAALRQSDQGVRGLAFAGTGGLVALNAAWASVSDRSDISASLGSGVRVLQAQDVRVQALDRRNVEALALGASIGAIAAGASVAKAEVRGSTSATIGSGAVIGTVGQDVDSLTVLADARVKATSVTVAAAGGIGVLAASGSSARATAEPQVSASLDGGVFRVAGAAEVEAIASAGASADALGFSVSGGLGIGASLAQALSAPTVSAWVGNGSRVDAGSLRVAASHVLPDRLFAFDTTLQRTDVFGTAVRAEASGTSGGLLLGATGTDAVADYGRDWKSAAVSAHVGDGSSLEVPGNIEVSATHNSSQRAAASGLALGIAAVGAHDARARSYTDTQADLGANVSVVGDAAGRLSVIADSSDTNIATAVSGSGGVIAGAAAQAVTLSQSDTRAFIGDADPATTGHTIRTGRVTVHASHDTVYNAKVDSTQASVAGASGARNAHQVDSDVDAGVGRGVEVTASNITLRADNLSRKSWWGRNDDLNSIGAADAADWNVNSGSGGLLNLPAGRTETTVLQRTGVDVGEGALLHVTLSAGANDALTLEASNTVVAYDKTKLDSGGAIALAASNSMIDAGRDGAPISADVSLGRNARLLSDSGDIDINSRNDVKLDARAVANAYGLAGAPSGKAWVNYHGSTGTEVGEGVLMLAADPLHGEIRIGAGRGSSLVADSHVNLWNKTAIPINSTPDARTVLHHDATLSLAAGSSLLAGGDVEITADRGSLRSSAVGIGKDLYREVAAAIAGVFGIDASLDIKAGYAPAPSGVALATVDGNVLAGLLRQSATQIDVDIASPWTYNDTSKEVSIGWGLKVSRADSRVHSSLAANPLEPTLANPYIGVAEVDESNVAPNSQLQERLNRLYLLQSQYAADAVASAAYASEIAFLEKKLVSQGVGQRSTTVTARGSAALSAAFDAQGALLKSETLNPPPAQADITGNLLGDTQAKQVGAVGTLVAAYGAIDADNDAIDLQLRGMKSAAPTTDPGYATLNTARNDAAAAYNGGEANLMQANGETNLVSAVQRIGNYGLATGCDAVGGCTVAGPLGTLGSAARGETLTIAGSGYLGAVQQLVNNVSQLAVKSGGTGTLESTVQDIATQMNQIKNANATIEQSVAEIRDKLTVASATQNELSGRWRDTAATDNVDTGRVSTVQNLRAANTPRIDQFDAAKANSAAQVIAGAAAVVSGAATRANEASATLAQKSDTAVPGSEKLLTFDPIEIKLRDVNVKAERLSGSGQLQAPGDAKIWILNNAPASLKIGNLSIDSSGGNVRLNGFLVNDLDDLRSFNSDFSGDIVSRENGVAGAPEIRIISTYDPDAYCCKPTLQANGETRPLPPAAGTPPARQVPAAAPDITLAYRDAVGEASKTISNPNGRVVVSSEAGDIYVDGSITAGSVSVLAKNGDFVQQYVNGFNSVAGEPSNNAQGGDGVLAPVSPVGPGIVANGNIFLSARYLNINGLVQSGIVSHHLDIPDDASLRFVLPEARWAAFKTQCGDLSCTLDLGNGQRVSYEKEWRGLKGEVGRVVANKAYVDQVLNEQVPVAVTTNGTRDFGAIEADYDPATQEITMKGSAKVRGGSIVLFGQIINTAAGGSGKLAVLDGFGQIEVNNRSSLALKLGTLDTGADPDVTKPGRGTAGTIHITDVQYVGAAGDPTLYAIETLITRHNGQIEVTQKGAWIGADFEPDALFTGFSAAPYSAERVSVTGARDGSYNPQDGLRYVFTTGSSDSTQYTWVFKGQSFFGTSSLSLPPSGVSRTQSGPPRPISNELLKDGTYLAYKAPAGTVAHGNQLATDAALNNTGGGSATPVARWSSPPITTDNDYTKIAEWNDCDWWSLCISSKYTSIWTQTLGQTTITTNSVKADYPIAIEFLGADRPSLNIQSANAALSLAAGEQLNNRHGDTLIDAKSLSAGSGSLIDTRNLTLHASAGSIGAEGAPIHVLLGGALTATARQGNVMVRQVAGSLRVDTVSAAADATGGVGKVQLAAQDNIRGRDANSLVSAARIELQSSTGAIGGASAGSALRVAPGYTADRSRQADFGLNASAARDIDLEVVASAPSGNNPQGHLLVDQVVSAGGDVRLNAPGQILDNNPEFTIDSRSYAQLLAYADTVGLRANQGSNTQKLTQALAALENSRTQQFTQYWQVREGQGAPAAYDASWRYRASVAERAALNNNAVAIAGFETDRTSQYWRLAEAVAGFDAGALARGQEAARLQALARAQDAAQLRVQHPQWTQAQIDAQVQILDVANAARRAQIKAQVLAADAAGTLAPASDGARIDGFVYIASNTERAAQEQGSSWTNSQLALAVNPGVLKDLTDTNPVIKAPNVSGRHVELLAGTSLGSTLPAGDPAAVVIPLNTDGDLSDAQKVALATAEFSDFSFSDPTRRSGTVTISQRLPLNFSASQGLSASVGDGTALTPHLAGSDTGNAYLTSLGGVKVDRIEADGEVRLKVKGDLTALDPGSTAIRAGDLILEAANGRIGADADALTPLRVEVARSAAADSFGSLTARASGRIHLLEVGDMALGGIFSRDAIRVVSESGSILNARPADNSGLVLLAGALQLSATQGSIGDFAARQPLAVGTTIGTLLSGQIQAEAGQWIDLFGPANLLVPSLFDIGPVDAAAAALRAGSGIQLQADNDLRIQGAVVTAGALNLVSGGRTTLRAARETMVGDPAGPAGAQPLQLPDAELKAGGETLVRAGELWIEHGATLHSGGPMGIVTQGDAVVTGLSSSDGTADALRITSLGGSILAGHAPGSNSLDIVADAAPQATLTLAAARGIGAEPLNIRVRHLDAASGGVVDLAVQGAVQIGSVLAADRIWLKADGSISGGTVFSSGSGGQSDQSVTLQSMDGPVNLATVAGRGDVAVTAAQGVTLDRVASTDASVGLRSRRADVVVGYARAGDALSAVADAGSVDIGTAEAAAAIELSALGDIALGAATSGARTALAATQGSVHVASIDADDLTVRAGRAIDIDAASLRSDLQLYSPSVRASVVSGSQSLTGSITGLGGALADGIDLALSGPGGFLFDRYWAESASLRIAIGALSIDDVRIADQAAFRNPRTFVLVDQDHLNIVPSDVELYSASAPFYLRLSGNQIGTDAFVIRRSPLHEVTSPDGPVRSAAEIVQDTLVRVSLEPPPVVPPPVLKPPATLVRFTGTPVSTEGVCAPDLNPDCAK
jgi:filamentous hemagglutinin family protein